MNDKQPKLPRYVPHSASSQRDVILGSDTRSWVYDYGWEDWHLSLQWNRTTAGGQKEAHNFHLYLAMYFVEHPDEARRMVRSYPPYSGVNMKEQDFLKMLQDYIASFSDYERQTVKQFWDKEVQKLNSPEAP